MSHNYTAGSPIWIKFSKLEQNSNVIGRFILTVDLYGLTNKSKNLTEKIFAVIYMSLKMDP